jgi:tape measure domain-containing protein
MTAIKVELELVDGSFTTRMLHAGETVAQFNRNVARSSPELRRLAAAGQSVITSMEKVEERSQSFLGTLRDITIVTGAISIGFNKLINIQDTWIGKVVQTNAEFERLVYQMRSMSTASDPIKEAAKEVDGLIEAAKNAPFSLKALSDGFSKLKASGTDPLKGSLQAISDGVAAFGGTDAALERTILGISQASGKGVLQMEELRQQISESMPQAVSLMAASMGVSIATLVDKIGTGRLAAKESLELFYAELDRSFGGTARRMMETFSGQIARTQTQLQEFARIIGGIDKDTGLAAEGGFFATLTDQIRDLNDALSSPGGENFARSIGQGLTAIIGYLRSAVETAYEWRQAIGNTAELLAFVAGLRILGGALSTIRAGYQNAMIGLTMLRAGFAQANAAAALHQRALANSAVSIASVDRAARLAAATGMRAMIGTMVRVAPVAGVLGLAIYEVADAFDVFGSRGKEAIETLREFGQLSADQVGKAQDNIEKRQRDLNKELAQITYSAQHSNYGFIRQKDRPAAIAAEIERQKQSANIAERQKEIDEDRLKLAEAREKLAEQQAEKDADRLLRAQDKEQQKAQRTYVETRNAIQKRYDDEIKMAEKTGKKVSELERARTEELKKNALAYYEEQISSVQKAIDGINSAAVDGKLTDAGTIAVGRLNEQIDQLQARKDALKNFGEMPDIGDTDQSAKGFEKLEKAVEKAKTEVESLEDQIGGADDELADFQAKFANGAYGDKSLDQVRQLGEEMANLLIRKKALDDINEGAKDIRQDIEQARIKMIERRMELQEKAAGRELTDGEKIAMRIKEGYYKGFGPNNPAQKAVEGMIEGLSLQASTAAKVGDVLRGNTFGDHTANKIQTVNDKLAEMLNLVKGIGTGVNGISFDNMGAPNTGAASTAAGWTRPNSVMFSGDLSGRYADIRGKANLMSSNMARWGDPRAPGWKEANLTSIATSSGMTASVHKAAAAAFQGFIKELEASGYKIKSLGGQNTRNKVGRNSLSEHAWGNAIDINPAENPFGQDLKTNMPINISQLAAKYGLSWGGDWKSVKDAMHFEWTGIGADEEKPAGPLKSAATSLPSALPTFSAEDQAKINEYMERRNKLQDEFLKQTTELTEEERKVMEAEKAQDGADYKSGLLKKIETAKESLDGLDKNYRATMQLINDGAFGSKDPNTELNKELLRISKELDAVEKGRADRKEASGNIENAELRIKEQELQMERRIAELKQKAANPNVKLDSSGLVEMRESLDKYLTDVATVYGKDTAQYQAATQRKTEILKMFSQQEVWEETAASSERTRAIQQGLMGEMSSRQAAMQQELDIIDQKMAYYRNQGTLDVQMTEQFEREKASIRAKYAQQDPIGAKMKEWGDLQGNLNQAAAGWMDSMADGLAGLITGTGNLRQTLQGIANDMVKMLLKYAMSGLMGKKGGAGAAVGKAGKGGAAAATGGKGKMFPAFHVGGIAGSGARMGRMVNPAVFKNARKFHTGANSFGAGRLMPGEMPAIVKKDEGIFTPEQMKALGTAALSNNQSVQINAPVTVNANGGTPEQNADLANQVAKQMEGSMRGIVADELMKQMRPGNMLNNGRTR